MRTAVAALMTLIAPVAGCAADDESGDDVGAPVVLVPNEVLVDLVERVSCVEEVEATVEAPSDGSEPVLVVTLDEQVPADPDIITVSVPTVATTIDRPGPDDPWVWLDPIRFGELAQGVGGALTLSGEFDADLIDRCLARLDAEMVQLDATLFELTRAVADDRRNIDTSVPGVAYFASRYEFLVDESEAAVRAARIISTDRLDGAASYDEMMLTNVQRALEALGSP